MIVIIPLGGIGTRFKDDGYQTPKALIDVLGIPIISYLLDNLNTTLLDYIFIPYNYEYKRFCFENYLTDRYPTINFKFFCLEKNTRGAAETIKIGIDHLQESRNVPVLCLDSDSFYLCDVIKNWDGKNCIFSFEDFDANAPFSYIKFNDNHKVISIVEKQKISNHACCGAYGFESIQELYQYATKIIIDNLTQKSEFYISGVIQQMLKDQKHFEYNAVDRQKFIQLGVPKDIEKYSISMCEEQIKLNKYNTTLHVYGHSNFHVHILHLNNTYFFCKSSTNYEDSIRLSRQIQKQTQYRNLFQFLIPEVFYEVPKTNTKIDQRYFLMKYLNNSITCFQYLIENSHSVLDTIFSFIINVIDTFIHHSIYIHVDREILLDKLLNIKTNLTKIKSVFHQEEYEFLQKKIQNLENQTDNVCKVAIPVGYCHGDLTLSNMLFDLMKHDIYLIDFLDSFVETPLFDIIKIRQDTKNFWSLNMIKQTIDQNKVRIALHHLDNKIDTYFQKYEFYNNNSVYEYFETLNHLRVLQYCKSEKIKSHILQCLKFQS
tara:strand:+ start:68 stop:1699 length:1632 start_codon:yes stop_codon:yes gene_type:complete